MKRFFFGLMVFSRLALPLFAAKYVAPNGSDTNPGTIDQPCKTIAKAIAIAVPGDTIFVRGGSYPLTTTINISKSGLDSTQRYFLFAFSNEKPLLDFSGTASGRKGLSLTASYWHIKGLDVKGAGDNGMEISGGSYNIIEFCSFYENRDSGLQLSNGAANNRIINCDSYFNADPPDYADADGFAPKLTVGSGNYFYGCRAWGNCDDGWDGYMRGANNVTTTLENCWTWKNGYRKDGTDPGSQANGNGFKMGGGDNSNSEQLMHHFVLKNCLAFDNKAKGFDQNNNVGSMTLWNCTGCNNHEANFRITRTLNPGQTLSVKNSVAFTGVVELGSFAIQEKNGWMPGFVVTTADFLSLDPALAAAPRQADGSLPEIDFMHLARGSDLIDAGVDLGRPFKGKAPDLGAFESDFVTAVAQAVATSADFYLYQNYPNPFNPVTKIGFQLPRAGRVKIRVYNAMGQWVATLLDKYVERGDHAMVFDAGSLPSGVYWCRMESASFVQMQKMLLIR